MVAGMDMNTAFFATAVLLLAVLAVYAVALVQVAGHKDLTNAERIGWLAAIVLLPLLGSILWFGPGRDGTATSWIRRQFG